MKRIYILFTIAIMMSCNRNNAKNNVDGNGADSTSTCAYDNEEEEEENYAYPHVCTSEDGVLSIESAVHPYGGTAPDYWSRWKFKNEAGKVCEIYQDNSAFIENVHSIKKTDGSTYYLTHCYGRASSSDTYEWLEAYKISGDTVVEVGVIDGGTKTNSSDFAINYCAPIWHYTVEKKGYDWIFEYDPIKQELYVPIITINNYYDPLPSDRYKVWKFGGHRFVFVGEKPNKHLHQSLADYEKLYRLYETKDYIVRVDSLKNKTFRYASWKKPKTLTDEPDLIITGGRRNEHQVAYDELPICDDYYFSNSGYEYIVNYCEIARGENNKVEHHDFLIVKKDGKILLKQEKL